MIGLRQAFAAAVLALGSALLAAAPAGAQDFYKDKKITLIVPSQSGGGFDIYSRIITRYMPKYIPGNPTFIVQNMPGASGAVGANYMKTAANDGTVMAYIAQGKILSPLMGEPAAKYDSREFTWLGSVGKLTEVCSAWAATGIKTLNDAKTRTVRMAATGAIGNDAQVPVLLNDKLGTKFKVIRGYTATGTKLSVERGETDGLCITYQTLGATNPRWLTEKLINVLIQVSAKRHPELPDVPSLIELLPDGPDRQAVELMSIPDEIGRSFIMPPGVPADRTQIMRRAFDQTMKDPEFLVEAKKLYVEVNPVNGEDSAALINKAYSYPASVIKRAAELLGNPVPEALLGKCDDKPQGGADALCEKQ